MMISGEVKEGVIKTEELALVWSVQLTKIYEEMRQFVFCVRSLKTETVPGLRNK